MKKTPSKKPISIDGYYPLYTNENDSNDASTEGTSHKHFLRGTKYFMPNGLILNKTMFHGGYKPKKIKKKDSKLIKF